MMIAERIREFGWRAIGKVSKAPGGAAVEGLYRSQRPWQGFVPTTTTIADLTVDVAAVGMDEAERRGVDLLERHGIVILANALSPDDVAKAREDAVAFKAQVLDAIPPGRTFGEAAGYAWQVGLSRLKTFMTLANAEQPVALIRSADDDEYDVDMFEVYNIDELPGDARLAGIDSVMKNAALALPDRILSHVHHWARIVTNLYQNDAVTKPRGLHIDCLAKSYKTFIYLSDCSRLSDGPYSYVPGSQRRRDLLVAGGFVNVANGGTDTDFPELAPYSLPMLGAAGTIIISAQFGVHGGHPQSPDGQRSVLVRNYTTLEKS